MSAPGDTADSGFDMDSALNSISSDLGLKGETDYDPADEADEAADPADADASGADDATEGDDAEAAGDTPPAEAQAQLQQQQAPTVREPPASWSKDKHELWKSLSPEAQEYYEVREKQFLSGLEQYKESAAFAKQLQEVMAPYRPMFQAQGVSEREAVQYLLNAQYRLTSGTAEERMAAYRQIGEELGFLDPAQADPNAPQVDPAVQELRQELNALRSEREQERQAVLTREREKANSAVSAFAADPKNEYFNEVATDMIAFVKAGLPLQDAYDRAVWANPTTRAKAQAKALTESAEAAKAAARKEAEEARKATASNVRAAETARRAPTESKGKFLSDASMRDELARIKARSN